MFSFKYSPRPRTLAGQRIVDDVSGAGEDAPHRRAAAAARRTIQSEILDAMVGEDATRCWSTDRAGAAPDEWAGRTAGNTIVNVRWRTPSLGRLASCSAHHPRPASTEAGPNAVKGACHADRDDHQGPDDRPGHQHARSSCFATWTARRPARSGSASSKPTRLPCRSRTSPSPRPMTHDLLRNVIEDLQGRSSASSSPT